jgi:hypothetical protein
MFSGTLDHHSSMLKTQFLLSHGGKLFLVDHLKRQKKIEKAFLANLMSWVGIYKLLALTC